MAWRLDGTYFESCSCDEICPCTWSAFTAKATLDRCRALLAYAEVATELLLSTANWPLPTITHTAGCAQESHLALHFKRLTGLTPRYSR